MTANWYKVMTDVLQGQSDTGLLPIGAVVAELRQTHPDVSHSSLRFLEREGLIIPARTPGGHRLYARSDVSRVRQIKTWQAQRLSLDDIRQRLAALDTLDSPTEVAQRFVSLVVAGEVAAAAEAVLRADDLGLPLGVVFREVLTPALIAIGELRAADAIIVGQEKAISVLARDLIAQLAARHAHSKPHGALMVASCVEGEHHDLGLHMACGLLRARGRRVHCLGANVALPFLLEAVRFYEPALILLSATQSCRLPAIAAAIAAIDEIRFPAGSLPIVVGGQIVTDHAATLRAWRVEPADLDRLDRVIAGGLATPRGETVSA